MYNQDIYLSSRQFIPFARIAISFSNISIKSEQTTCSNKIILLANNRQLVFLLIRRGLRAFIQRSRRSVGYLFGHKFYFLVGRLIAHEGSISAAKNLCRDKTRGESYNWSDICTIPILTLRNLWNAGHESITILYIIFTILYIYYYKSITLESIDRSKSFCNILG